MSKDKDKLPVVAVVGRPNVGKSTLFNRLIGKRRAITDPTPGVTRDPIDGIWEWDDRRVRLVDTGGIKLDQEEFDSAVAEKSIEYIDSADLVLLLLEAKTITPEDEEVMAYARRWTDKVVVVVNKVDHEKHESDVWNYYQYGFSRVVGISATHGRGIEELEEMVEEFIPPSELLQDEEEGEQIIRVAVLGKPNTGKSTLCNLLTQTEASIVSPIAGTTRDVVEGEFQFGNQKFTLLDTAGIRRKKKVDENVEYYSVNRALATIDECDVVFLMVDAKEGLSDQDKKIAQHIVKRGRGVIIVLNKWDLVQEMPNQIEAITDRVRFLFPILQFAPIIPISATTSQGLEDLLKKSISIYKQLNTRIETSQINSAIKAWLEYKEPPRPKSGSRFKVYYATQTSRNPVEFVLFGNAKKKCPLSYINYLKNNIRKEFRMKEIPIAITIREKTR